MIIKLSVPIALVAVATLATTPLHAQQPRVETSLRALRAVLAVTHREPPRSGPPRMRFAYRLDGKPGCGVKLTSSWKTGQVERRTVSETDLSALSPEVEILRSPGDSLVIVSAHSSSGRPEVLHQVVRGSAARQQEQIDKLVFLLWDHALADSLADRLADAVRACGGRV